jgi:hypothetical protein
VQQDAPTQDQNTIRVNCPSGSESHVAFVNPRFFSSMHFPSLQKCNILLFHLMMMADSAEFYMRTMRSHILHRALVEFPICCAQFLILCLQFVCASCAVMQRLRTNRRTVFTSLYTFITLVVSFNCITVVTQTEHSQ